MGNKIVGKGALLGNLAHEHRDRASDGLIDINNKHLVGIAQENCTPAAGRQNRTNLHLNHRLVHTQTVPVRTGKTSGGLDASPLFVTPGRSGFVPTRENFCLRACMFLALIHYHFLPAELPGPGNPK
jgi:hypothetical protein